MSFFDLHLSLPAPFCFSPSLPHNDSRPPSKINRCPVLGSVLSRKEHTNFAFLFHSRWVKRFISASRLHRRSAVALFFCECERWINGTRSFSFFSFFFSFLFFFFYAPLSRDLSRCTFSSPSQVVSVGINFQYDRRTLFLFGFLFLIFTGILM